MEAFKKNDLLIENSSLWINGEPNTCLTLEDRSIQYGDGFFTTIAVLDGRLLNWSAHWQRIVHSCEILKLPLPDTFQLQQWVSRALSSYLQGQKQSRCVLKMVFTRGKGGKGYAPLPSPQINCLFYLKPFPVGSGIDELELLDVCLCTTPTSINGLQGIKSLNRLENVMARSEVEQKGCHEGIMQNAFSQVVCGTQSNLYVIKNGKIKTPIIKTSGVAGTTRATLNPLLLAKGWELQETTLGLEDIQQADEVFFTNAVRGVQAVNQFSECRYSYRLTAEIHQLWAKWQRQHSCDFTQLGFT